MISISLCDSSPQILGPISRQQSPLVLHPSFSRRNADSQPAGIETKAIDLSEERHYIEALGIDDTVDVDSDLLKLINETCQNKDLFTNHLYANDSSKAIYAILELIKENFSITFEWRTVIELFFVDDVKKKAAKRLWDEARVTENVEKLLKISKYLPAMRYVYPDATTGMLFDNHFQKKKGTTYNIRRMLIHKVFR